MSRLILFLEAIPTISGGQQVLIDIVPGLSDYDLYALLPGPGPLADSLQGAGVACHFAFMAQYTLVRKSWGDAGRFASNVPRLAWRAARLALRLGVDLIYANTARAFAWGAPSATSIGRPVLWHVDDILADRKSLTFLRMMGHLPSVRRIVAASQPAASQFGLSEKTTVIPIGIDTGRSQPDQAARERVRAELGIPTGAPIAGCVGDLFSLKDQRTLLEAARRGTPEIRYLIVGDARAGDRESAAYAEEQPAQAGHNVYFLGRREDMPSLLNAMDLLVISSTAETGPRLLLKAMACGLPVLSTPVGRAPELIEPSVTGDLFPVGDAATLVERLRLRSPAAIGYGEWAGRREDCQKRSSRSPFSRAGCAARSRTRSVTRLNRRPATTRGNDRMGRHMVKRPAADKYRAWHRRARLEV